MDATHIGFSGREEYANNAATLPVMTMLSEVPAPPMEASDAPSLRTSFRRNWSAPISTPRVPADVGQGEGEGLDLCLWAEAKRQQHEIPGAVQVTHAPASVRCPPDCGPQPAKDQCPELADKRLATRRSARGVREGAVTDPERTLAPLTITAAIQPIADTVRIVTFITG